MKLSFIFLMLAFLQVNASSYAQKVNIKVKNATINEVFYKLTQQTGHTFTSDGALLKKIKPITLNMNNAMLKEVLDKCFEGEDVKMFFNNEDKIVVIKNNSNTKITTLSPITLTGNITDENGQPLVGVSVKVKNTQTSTVSDVKGNYKIIVQSETAVLVFSYVGFATQEISVGKRSKIDVKLKQSNINLEETVVVAYGTVSRRDLTGSVGTVNLEDVVKAPVTTFTEALAGRVAGLQVSTAEGQPGMMQSIIIRGPGSLSQDPSPLYIIDGFPIEDFDPSTLNTNDIESISVLKDASAAALYGSRAANGVIVIETAKGKSGKPQVAFNSTFGYHQIRKKVEMMNAYEFVKYQYEFRASIARTTYLQDGKTLDDYRSVNGIDWQSKVFKTSPMQTYDLSIRGGNLYTQYALSGSLFNNEGIILNTGTSRKQGRISLNHTLSDKLKVGVVSNFSFNRIYGAQASLASTSSTNLSNGIFYTTFSYRPVTGREEIDLSDENLDDLVNPDDPNSTRVNPVKQLLNTYNVQNNRSLSVNAFVNYNITNNLIFKATGNIRDNTSEREAFYNSSTPQGLPIPRNNRGVQAGIQNGTVSTWLNENTLAYNKRFNRNHTMNALLGFSLGGGNNKSYGTNIMLIPNEELGMAGVGQGAPYLSSSSSGLYSIVSVFSRLNYNYKSKYLLTATFRGDGSSKFPNGNKWGYFPSGAFAWNIDREKFFKNITFISTAKLRTSYGMTGNNRISNFGYLPNLDFPLAASYSFNNESPTKGVIPDPNGLGNDKLKWETVEQLDIGLDLSFFKNRVKLEVDAYKRITHDMLLYADLPYATGFARVYQNIGKLSNDGLEFSLNTRNIVNKNFSWETSFNISFNKNNVLELTRGQFEMFRNNSTHYFYTDAFNISRIGEPAGQFWGYEWLGNYQYADFDEVSPGVYLLKSGISDNGTPRADIRPGDIKYKDQNGDGRISQDDMTVIGRGLPKHFGGFTNNFSYKNFNLNVFFQWNYGNNIYNANRLIFEGNGTSLSHVNQYASYSDRWTDENQSSKNFRTNGGGPQGYHSSRVLEDGSYLRLKTVSLSYNLPKQLIKKAGMSNLSVMVSGQNLLTWTKYSGFDPEVAVRNSVLTPGLDYSAYPQNKTFVAGIKAQF
ncbi:TonB-dependent receptor [Pedobacter sp. ASV1-7]|uniref:SusC/RagA family TonB-linked outer membrane protein n=1 Tax=Pedobacter sp. ASV1-7 TaxID=3145237 RepID=UPI0032E933C0